MMRHLLPNIVAPLTVLVTVYLTAILAEAGLSFLGLGTQPPEASWGGMLNTARSYIDIAWWLSVFPAGDHARGAGVQLPRRRPARHPRPAARPTVGEAPTKK